MREGGRERKLNEVQFFFSSQLINIIMMMMVTLDQTKVKNEKKKVQRLNHFRLRKRKLLRPTRFK